MSSDQTYNEKELLLRIADGDEHAFRPVFERYWDKIYSIAFRYTKSTSLSEDLVQEIFIKLWSKKEHLIHVEKFDSFLFILARNLIFNALRQKVFLVSFPLADSSYFNAEVVLPDQAFYAKESQELINQAVEKLPPQQKKVFVLSRVHGFSHEEIAREMGISIPTIKGHMTKALHFIRSYLDKNINSMPAIWIAVLAGIIEK